MNKRVIADLLEQLIYEIRQSNELPFSVVDNERITYAEGVIEELREEKDEELTENEAIKREVTRELYD